MAEQAASQAAAVRRAVNRGHIVKCRGRASHEASRARPMSDVRGPPTSAAAPSTATSRRAPIFSQRSMSTRATPPSRTSEDRLRPAGEFARATPTPLSVADVLNKVPPHLLGDQIVAEAQRIAGVSSAAIYLVDLEGTHLIRLAGALSFPQHLPVTLAVGTEIPQEGLPALRAVVEDHLPGAQSAPLILRGRALGTLVAVGNALDGPGGPRVRGGGGALTRRGLHRPPRRRPARAGDEPGGGDPAEPAPAAHRAHERRAHRRQRPPRLRDRGRLVRLRRERPGRGSASPTPRATARGRPRWRRWLSARSARRATRALELPETVELMDATVREISEPRRSHDRRVLGAAHVHVLVDLLRRARADRRRRAGRGRPAVRRAGRRRSGRRRAWVSSRSGPAGSPTAIASCSSPTGSSTAPSGEGAR